MASSSSMKDLARRMATQLAADARTSRDLLEMIDLWPVRESAYETRIRELEEQNARLEAAAISALDACLLIRNRNAGR